MKLTRKAATALSLVGGIFAACGTDAGNQTGPDAPLSVQSVSPADGAAGVSLNAPIVIAFSKTLQSGSASDATVSLAAGGTSIARSLTVAPDGRTVTLSPRGGLSTDLLYTLAVHGVKDQSGRALATPFTSGFTTVPADVTVQDPPGDTYGVASTGLVQPDITSFAATHDGADIVIVLQFAQPVQSDTMVGGANVVGGYIDLDTDQNATTGMVPSVTDIFRPPTSGSSGLGDEFVVDLFVNPDGTAAIFDLGNGSIAGYVTPLFYGNVVTIRVPLALLGNDDGNVNLATVVGTVQEPTDIAPNTGHLTLGTAGMSAARAGAARPASAAQRARLFAGGWGAR